MWAQIDWAKVFTNGWHLALLLGAAYAATNPKWAWIGPALQASGQMTTPPIFGTKPLSPAVPAPK